MNKRSAAAAAILVLLALFIRFWHLEYGFPHVFFPDESDIVNPVLKLVTRFREAIFSGDIDILRPDSFVYGTFPAYFIATILILMGKLSSLINMGIPTSDYYLWMRGINAVLSLSIPFMAAIIFFIVFKDEKGSILTFLLVALNWKLLYHAHYVNQDNFLTILNLASILFTLFYIRTINNGNKTAYLCIAGVLLGFAIGTKVTAAIMFVPIVFILIKRKLIAEVVVFSLFAVGAFAASNPFSIINISDFAERIFLMPLREGGIVFTSADSNPLKYLASLNYLVSTPTLLFSFWGLFKGIRTKSTDQVLLFGATVTYILFFSLQVRRVDRWMLPIVPIMIIYAVRGIMELKYIRVNIFLKYVVTMTSIVLYIAYTTALLYQISLANPRAEAYEWFKKIERATDEKVLVYTEDGNDPFMRLRNADIIMFNVYQAHGAENFAPAVPNNYKWIVLSSKALSTYKNPYVVSNFPEYHEMWVSFENEIYRDFKIEKEFKAQQPNLLNVPTMTVFRKEI